jgi:Ca-activated chloride channel homolog
MKKLVIVILLFSVALLSNAQNERRFVRQGNRFYLEGLKDTTRLDTTSFSRAETEYRRALEKRPNDQNWNFNLSNSQYKQMRFEESAAAFKQLADQANTPEERARALHNLGNSLLFQQKIDESIDAYKEALRNNPSDLDTKYNLAYAQMLKNQPEDQQQNQDQNKDQQQDKQDQQQEPEPGPARSAGSATKTTAATQNIATKCRTAFRGSAECRTRYTG